ncbi:hypothetical protein [Burkholderia vietnamiensis]|uniref:hypothetical protein n=1 Tax=Burkholderia vietnamiensis TaxID=60552 RepID=UPI001CF138B3|nr:hypothetical protein [Burkholderia vietnamiensis]MCA8068545.1 hypothetical protein [Burkholderia vietnamiensis]
MKNVSGTTIWDQIVAAFDIGPNLADTTSVANGDALIGVKQPFTNAVARTQHDKNTDMLTIADFNSATDAANAGAGRRLFVNVGESVTLNVPTQFTTIPAALSAIAGWVIHGSVTIKVADGSYSLSNIVLNHPYGNNCHLIGNVTTPANCVLSFNSSDGITVAPGTKWGEVNGFYIQKTGGKSNFGCSTFGGQFTKLGPNVVVDGFYYGIAALDGGVIYADGTDANTNRVEVKNGGDVGIWAISGSFVSAVYAYSHDNSDSSNPGNPLGGGFIAEFASAMVCNNAKATGNLFCGFGSNSGSSMRAWTVTSTGNGHGLNMGSLAAMEVFGGATITNNTWYGLHSDGAGQCYGFDQATVSGNGLGSIKNPLYIGSDTSIHIDSGSLTVNAGPENATAGSTYIDRNTAANQFSMDRYLTSGSEVWRKQFRRDSNTYTWGGGGVTGLIYTPLTGDIGAGKASPALNSANGFFQIPAMGGAPTGSPTALSGYAPIIFDTVNNKIWIWNGSAWKGVTLS